MPPWMRGAAPRGRRSAESSSADRRGPKSATLPQAEHAADEAENHDRKNVGDAIRENEREKDSETDES